MHKDRLLKAIDENRVFWKWLDGRRVIMLKCVGDSRFFDELTRNLTSAERRVFNTLDVKYMRLKNADGRFGIVIRKKE